VRNAVCALLLTTLAAAQADTSALAARLKRVKIAAFYKAIEERQDLDAATKTRILALREGATLGGEFGCVHQSLLMLYPEYKRADTILLDERFAVAAELFLPLMNSKDPYLKAYATFRYGLAEMNREQFKQAVDAFTTVLNRHRKQAGCDAEAAFYLAVSLGQAREKEKAIVAAQRFLDDYPDAPQRYRAAMEQMKNELVQEWESPLYGLAGRMSHVARKIEGGDTGDPTQKEQKEIIDIIEELIKRAEQNEGQGQGGGQQGGAPRDNRQPNSHAPKSQVAPGPSRVGDLRKSKAKAGEKWGAMRDKEREEVLQALKEKFPERYRELLEQYNKALAEGRRVTEPTDEAEEAPDDR